MHKKTKLTLQIVFVAVLLIAAFVFAQKITDSQRALELVQNYGYGGIFLLAIIGGFNIFVPIPAITFMPVFLAAGLNQWLIIFTIALGATVADTAAFLIGRIGNQLSQQEKNWVKKIRDWRDQHYLLPLFILLIFAIAIPLPNEILLIPLGYIGYKYSYILPVIFVGNFLFNTLAGLGIINLFKFFS